jgi:hypothetical protein
VFVDQYYGVANGGTAQGDTFSSIENVVGSAYSDVIHGHDGPNTLTGLEGDDHLSAHGGADVLDGGYGNDHFTGGPGADTFYGGPDRDTVSYFYATSGVSATLGGYGYGGEAHGDRMYDVESLIGTYYNDTRCTHIRATMSSTDLLATTTYWAAWATTGCTAMTEPTRWTVATARTRSIPGWAATSCAVVPTATT